MLFCCDCSQPVGTTRAYSALQRNCLLSVVMQTNSAGDLTPAIDPTTDIARLSNLRCGKCFSAGVRHLILWHPRRSGGRVRRREFITLLGGAAVGWPLAASAQTQPKIPRVGCVYASTPHWLPSVLRYTVRYFLSRVLGCGIEGST